MKGFVKTKLLQPGEKEIIIIYITSQDLAIYNNNNNNWIYPTSGSVYEIHIGSSSTDLRLSGKLQIA